MSFENLEQCLGWKPPIELVKRVSSGVVNFRLIMVAHLDSFQ